MADPQQLIRFHDGGSTLIIDNRYFPLTIYTWFGAGSIPLVDEYFKRRWENDARARKENTKVILVTDLAHVSPPPATFRKAMGERAKETDVSDALHCYITSVPNALMRGVITAMQWIGGEQMKRNTNVANMAQALHLAINEYEKLGIDPPQLNVAEYVSPTQR